MSPKLPHTHKLVTHAFLKQASTALVVALLFVAQSAHAYVGENLLKWASDNIVLPLGRPTGCEICDQVTAPGRQRSARVSAVLD